MIRASPQQDPLSFSYCSQFWKFILDAGTFSLHFRNLIVQCVASFADALEFSNQTRLFRHGHDMFVVSVSFATQRTPIAPMETRLANADVPARYHLIYRFAIRHHIVWTLIAHHTFVFFVIVVVVVVRGVRHGVNTNKISWIVIDGATKRRLSNARKIVRQV